MLVFCEKVRNKDELEERREVGLGRRTLNKDIVE